MTVCEEDKLPIQFDRTINAREDYLQLQRTHEHRRKEFESSRLRWRSTRIGLMIILLGLVAVSLHFSLLALFSILLCVLVGFTLITAASGLEERAESRQRSEEIAIALSEASVARIDHRWHEFPVPEVSKAFQKSPLAIDLDLFGSASVMQRISVAESTTGRETLASWLLEPAGPDEILERQGVVGVLSRQPDWRFQLQLRCAAVERCPGQTSRLIDWAESAESRALHSVLDPYCKCVPLLGIAVVALLLVDLNLFAAAAISLLAVNFIVTIISSGDVHQHFRRLSVGPFSASFQPISNAFAHLRDAQVLKDLMPEAVDAGRQAATALRRLERLHALGSLSSNVLTMVYIYLPLQAFLLWDQQLYRLARKWRTECGSEVFGWFRMLGKTEALSSLAGVAYENPQWQFPLITSASSPEFNSENLGHPLIPESERVLNDVSFGPPGTLLLITGSNMGGKSTILRAVGVAVVLAQAGSPCCCSKLTMSPLELLTSIKASDSLAHSMSLFMAQLLSIKNVVDRLKHGLANQQTAPIMYLLDEILNGTNTADRRVIVEQLIGFTLNCRAIGAMTTHDLDLPRESSHARSIRCLYMGHQAAGADGSDELHFDYKLRSGISTAGSAVVLARMLGLNPSDDQ